MAQKLRPRRFSMQWAVNISHATASRICGRTVNISTTGLLFVSPLRFRVGDLVTLEIDVNGASFIRCNVKIVRERVGGRGMFVFGATFAEISDAHRKILSEALLKIYRSELGEDYTRFTTQAADHRPNHKHR